MLPKDVKALIRTAADQAGMELKVLGAVEAANAAQKHVLSHKIKTHLGDDLSGQHFAAWGLAFKPQTNDMREAPVGHSSPTGWLPVPLSPP